MPIDYDLIKNLDFPDVEHTYSEKDSMLYALAVGYGHDPLDESQLAFVYEKDLKTAPSMPVILGYPGFWMKDPATGIDWPRLLHVGHKLQLHAAIPPAGTVVGRTRIKAIIDKGAARGALVVQEKLVLDKVSGALLATIEQATLCRTEGGFGQGDAAPPALPPMPCRPSDLVCDLPTLPQSALLYRLCADPNPMHADPAVARAAGYARPVLHGLCSFGVAVHAVLKSCCGYDPRRLASLSVRFSSVVYPGEMLRTELWVDGAAIAFRTRALERGVVVLDYGAAALNI
ncbi:MaoC/PaaZ C-terminal domain-containing protein [Noviherbaspirillum suwonense]|uniref:Acyl dehydratase n=1 Tax=Noviherbaspirillum suwonense TaxID=1224511 RepID=A0ABY1QWW1_9BURK|nr:MaoC/PaaZ C-terminal domain-containing protein [Noviherbaspirillum suwonense]SMP82316.1 Acyl dehydratase [Noviherbaspirillum suwonense]